MGNGIDITSAPEELRDCAMCGGTGYLVARVTVYEHGCGFPHDDTDERPCPHCGGFGHIVTTCEGDSNERVD